MTQEFKSSAINNLLHNIEYAKTEIALLQKKGPGMFVLFLKGKAHLLLNYATGVPAFSFTNRPFILSEADALKTIEGCDSIGQEVLMLPAIEWYERFLADCEETLKLF